MIRPRTLILLIGTNALEGVLLRGDRVIAEQTHHVDAEAMRTAWESGLASLESPLEVLCAKLGCSRGDRVVVVARPSVSGTTYRVGAVKDETLERANELAAAHACSGFDSSELSTHTWSWNRPDRLGEQVLLSGAVPDALLVEIAGWVGRAGLQFEGFVPMQMWEMARAMRAAEQCPAGTVCCRIGPEYTVLVADSPKNGIVVRAVEFGVQGLVNVYARAAQHRGHNDDPGESWRLMLEHGVRWRKGEELSDVVRDALPMLAPVLQRLNIELKQTMRYQVGTEAVASRIRCLGIGRRVPGLDNAIAGHLELSLDPGGLGNAPIASKPCDVRELDTETIRALLAAEHFLPRVISRGRRTRRLAGVAAQSGVIAALMVFGEHRLLSYEARGVHNKLVELERTLDVYETSAVLGQRIKEDKNLVLDQLLTLDQVFGKTPYWPGLARLLTDENEIQIDAVRISTSAGKTVATVSGVAPAGTGDAVLRDLMGRWRASSMVRSVEPTSLIRQTSNGRDTLRFTLGIEMQQFPVWFHRDELAGLTGAEIWGRDVQP